MSAPIGIMGGTFDPVHFGHLRVDQEAAEIVGLERVRWVPAGQPWHRGAPRATATHRLEMVRLAIGKNDLFELDDAEIRFFFQAEDGIRDLYVTGVQTCALPI